MLLAVYFRDTGIFLDMDKDFLKEHFAFILTIFVTYVFNIVFIVVQFVMIDGTSAALFFDIMLNALIPTTITYVFGCVLVNIVELFKDNAENYVFNILTICMVFIYAIAFVIYWKTGFMWEWLYGELIATAFMICLNILCYREKYRNRNHGVV